jgi:pyrimidine deaminase RibD-like protein
MGNSATRRFLRHGDAQAWIQDYNARNAENDLELVVREIEPATAQTAAPESGSVQWNIVADDGETVHTFYNRNVQADANSAALAWVQANWRQPLNMAARGPFEVVPAAIPGSTQDLQRQRMAAASQAADAAPSMASQTRPTPIPGVQDIEPDVAQYTSQPTAPTQWEVYRRSDGASMFPLDAATQAQAWAEGRTWVQQTSNNTGITLNPADYSVRQSAQPVTESREITKLGKLDSVLERCISMIHRGQESDPEKYGRVAACLIDNKNNHTYAINLPGPDGTRRHAERVAIDTHLKRHGRIGANAIMITTLSPCVNDMSERDGESCTELLSDYGIEKCYAGWQDPTQHPAEDYPFNLQITDNADIFNTCKDIAASFLPMDMADNLNETVNPDCFDPAFNDTQHFDGLTYRATVEEEYGKPVLTIKVLDDNFQQVGLSKFKQSKKGVVSLITSFRPEYQGQGIARNIYAYVRMLGNTIVPSRNQLPPGRAMWAAWKKSGDAKHLMTDVAENFAEGFTNYQGLRPPKNILGTNLFPGQDIVGQRVYHCTNRLEAIKKSGGLKPRRDATGEREYGRLSTDEHPFIPVIGIWFSVGKPDWPGKHCVSFVIEPTDQVYVAYANTKGLKPNVVLNTIELDRLTVEGQQDVDENFADGQNPGRKELDPDVYEDLANGIIARVARQIVPTIRAKSTPEGYVYLSTQDGLSLVIGCNIAGGSIDINIGSQPMETTSSGPHKGAVTKIIAAVYQAAVKRYGQPTEQGTLSIDHDAGHGVWQHIAQKLGLQYDAHMVKENFADGRHPEDKGDSKRHGIPKHTTLSQLDKIGHGSGRKAQLARWQANMRRGRAK